MANDDLQRHALQRIMQRRSAPKNERGDAVGRDGRVPKQSFLKDLEIGHGMKRREEKGGHPLLPNAKRPLDDEPLEKNWQGKGNVPTHGGMVTHPKSNVDDALRGTHDTGLGNEVLQEAARLGKPLPSTGSGKKA
ncbi:MAG TPA: hypothetical protein VKR55_29455 [Bradyrhizobium sp.]|uniref:hypothetical protein n=1 Tax=Bradyrhizobium sp. TaxID=376 RepID=UPI002B71E71A|nr:hypothetical protein [Bradyrhizobium sp.]HLZ06266.1 hypothetical protein [Bradyrhizobium sp.]